MKIDPFMYSQNHGRRTITLEERLKAIAWLDEFVPRSAKDRRDKVILEYFLCKNMSAQAIVREQDTRIIGLGNRNNGKPLTAPSVARIIANYFPEFKNRMDKGNGNKHTARIDMRCKRKNQSSPHVRRCAFCGTDKELEEHHMIPLCLGGTNDDENLCFLCKNHHREVSTWQKIMLDHGRFMRLR